LQADDPLTREVTRIYGLLTTPRPRQAGADAAITAA
jgi:hypothetical protein